MPLLTYLVNMIYFYTSGHIRRHIERGQKEDRLCPLHLFKEDTLADTLAERFLDLIEDSLGFRMSKCWSQLVESIFKDPL